MMNHLPDNDNERGFTWDNESENRPPFEFDDLEKTVSPEKQQPQMNESVKKTIYDLIGRGDLEGAINELVKSLPPSNNKAALALQRRWAGLRRQKIMGTIDRKDESVELNQITSDVLDLLNQPIQNSLHSIGNTNINHGHSALHTDKRKILFMAANPSDQGRLQVDEEFRVISTMLKQSGKRDSFELLMPELSMRIEDFIVALKQKPNIVHFAGHGKREGLLIVGNGDKSEDLTIRSLQLQFRRHRDSVKLIILNSCYSASQAKILSKLGIYVIGMNAPVGDKAALDFAKGIYVGIGAGESVENAYIDALTILESKNPDYAGLSEIWKDGEKVEIWG